MQYMISPMDLTERQLLIYNALYRRCNFANMEVSITVEGLITSIKIVDLTYKKVYSDIKLMEEKGYIQTIRKASKGTAPVYKIIKIEELGYQRETKGYQKKTKTKQLQGLDSNEGYQRETKGYQKATNSNDNDKDIYIHQNKFDDETESIWKLYPNKKGKAKAIKKLPKLIKTHGYEQMKRCVERYSLEVQDKDKQYIKHGDTFFNGAYLDYLDSNYIEIDKEQKREVNLETNEQIKKQAEKDLAAILGR